MSENVDTQIEPTEDNFGDAFARLAELAEGQEPPKEDEQVTDSVEETAEQPVESADDEVVDEVGESEEAAEEDAEEAAPAPAANDDVLERLARMMRESEQQQPQQQQQPAPQDQPAEEPVYTPDELEAIQAYEKDWPEVARAESLRRRAEYRELVSYVFNQVAAELRPIVETVSTISQRSHLSDLKSTVGDYDDVRDKVVEWAEQQPAYLQVAYKHVIENGTVDEVADLIDRYRRDTGATAQPKAQPAARQMETELPTATKQAAAALAPVSSKRSAVIQASDPDDFESAFASFASKM